MIPPTFPSAEQLRPAREKPEAANGSIVLVAVESAEAPLQFLSRHMGVVIPR